MQHTTNTQVIFADSAEEARKKYLALGIKPDHDENASLEIVRCLDDEDFDPESPFNLVGEISLSPEYMEKVQTDVERAYVGYYLEQA